MKLCKLVSLVLVFVLLSSVLCLSASAENKVNFVPEVKNGFLYGTATETPQIYLRAILKDRQVKIYKDGKELPADSDEYIATGFTVKLDERQFCSVVVLGDVNGDGELTPMDYLLVKRTYLGTYSLGGLALAAAGVESGEELRAMHYLMLKRAYFGTYDINKSYTCEPYDPMPGGWSNWI